MCTLLYHYVYDVYFVGRLRIIILWGSMNILCVLVFNSRWEIYHCSGLVLTKYKWVLIDIEIQIDINEGVCIHMCDLSVESFKLSIR